MTDDLSQAPTESELGAAGPPPVPEGDPTVRRIDGLAGVVESGAGRVDDDLLVPAREVLHRAEERLRLSGEHTIVALAGATGSGKSSTFNALTDLELAGTGVRRPTTSWALACAWGPAGAEEILTWMGIPPRHQVSRMSMLDRSSEDTRLDGLVLLDLPDHDSTEVSHHLEMERLLRFADLLVWVLDPQKYADAAIHDRYIKPMATHAEVTVVVLNQIDRIPYEQRQNAIDDLRRILAEEGLPDAHVVGVSATRGDGVEDLKRELAGRIRAKRAARERLAADVDTVAKAIAESAGTADVPGVAPADREALHASLVEAAGVSGAVEAVSRSLKGKARAMTGWPITSWIGPSRQARGDARALGELAGDKELTRAELAKAGAAAPSVQRSAAESAIRGFAERASAGLSRPWTSAVRRASTGRSADVVGALESTVASSDLGSGVVAGWWRAVQALQWLLLLGAIGGAVWEILGVAGVTEVPEVGGLPAGLVVLVGCLVAGLVLAVVSRAAIGSSTRSKARQADQQLRDAIADVARREVEEPVEAELAAYDRYRTAVRSALGE